MKVKNVMTKNPKTVTKKDRLEKVLKILSEYKITGCPVVDHRKHVVGVITQSDILRIIDVHAKINRTDSDFFSLLLLVLKEGEFEEMKGTLKDILQLTVDEFMNKKVVTIDDNENLTRL